MMPAAKLFEAALNGRYEDVVALIDSGMSIEETEHGLSVFHVSVVGMHEAIAEYLLDLGADPNRVDGSAWTPLMSAVDAVCDEVSQFNLRAPNNVMITRLLVGGADVNKPGVDGTTPIYLARHYGNDAVIRLLLNAGAVDLDC